MKLFAIIILFLIRAVVSGQDTSAVLQNVIELRKALTEKNVTEISVLLHTDIAFGHSNGWVQNKKDVLNDMRSGYLVYNKINSQSVSIEVKNKKAFVKEVMNVEGSRNGTDFTLKLFVLQLWVQTKKGWQLLIRQSTKI